LLSSYKNEHDEKETGFSWLKVKNDGIFAKYLRCLLDMTMERRYTIKAATEAGENKAQLVVNRKNQNHYYLMKLKIGRKIL